MASGSAPHTTECERSNVVYGPDGRVRMPLTAFPTEVLAVLSPVRTESSYLAGDAALHLSETSLRYSADLDLFHTTASTANVAFAADVV